MSTINISPAPTILATGLLQLQGGVAMSGTLTSVTDQNDTASPLKLSTTLVQTTSTLKITTADNPYIDAEDSAGNNRFTIGRDPSSQQVNVDFASNPTGSTTNVGAIRTYVDGVNLSEVMTFREDGLLTLSNSIQFSNYNKTIGGGGIPLNAIYSATLGLCNLIQDSGGGGIKFTDSGGSAYAKMGFGNLNTTIGQSTFGVVPDLSARLGVRGSGSTSATTSLLVQNSAGRNLIQLRDDGASIVNGDLYVTSPSFNGSLLFQCIGNYQQKIQGAYGENIVFGSGGNTIHFNANETVVSASLYAGNMSFVKNASYQGGTLNINNFFSSNTGTNYGLTIGSNYVNAGAGGPNYGKQVRFYDNLVNANIQCDMTFAYVNPTINYTSTGNGQIVGFDFNPNVVATTASTTLRAFQSSVGGVYINTTSYNASAILQADSTTQGFLPPRMTNAQRLAIATPAVGLMVYCTDAVEGLYVYKSTGWTFVI